jgi:HD-GYP domain-containing protein (c-di-GMP phosphodiesterase class II)
MSWVVVVAIVVVAWLALLVVVLCLLRVASLSDDAMAAACEREAAPARQVEPRSSGAALAGLVERVFVHDPGAGRHAAMVANLARELTAAAGLPQDEQVLAHLAGLLQGLRERDFFHAATAGEPDLGTEARRLVERHGSVGARVLREVPDLADVDVVVETLDERFDGSGTPYGLRGEQIPRPARIVAIADAYVRLTAADRAPAGADPQRVAGELRRQAGHALDAHLVEILLTRVVGRGPDQSAPFRPRIREALRALRHASS